MGVFLNFLSYSIDLYKSVFVLTPYCFGYCSFIVGVPFSFPLLFRNGLCPVFFLININNATINIFEMIIFVLPGKSFSL